MKKIEVIKPTMISGKPIEPGVYRIGKDLSGVDAGNLIAAQKAVEHIEPEPEPEKEPDSEKEKAPAKADAADVKNREDDPEQTPKTRGRGPGRPSKKSGK